VTPPRIQIQACDQSCEHNDRQGERVLWRDVQSVQPVTRSGRSQTMRDQSGLQSRGFVPRFDGADEAVATLGESLDKTHVAGRIAQGLSQFVDRRIEAVVEINEDFIWPEPDTQFLTTDQFSGSFQEQGQDLKRLTGETDLGAVLPQLTRLQVNLITLEADETRQGVLQGNALGGNGAKLITSLGVLQSNGGSVSRMSSEACLMTFFWP